MSKLIVSHSPHEKGSFTVQSVMWNVVIALVPAFIASLYFFGIRALTVTLTAVISCMIAEALIQKFLMKQEISVTDGSAVITGILLAFNLPSSIPLWQVATGSLVAIGIGKMAFGGLGKNPFNPALIGRGFMLISFPVDMTSWPKPIISRMLYNIPDSITAATPLGILKEGAASLPSWFDLFIGNIGGSLGETSAFAIIIGCIYLLYKKIITWHIPVFYIGTVFIFTGIFYLTNTTEFAHPMFHILSGGALLGAVFMMTDMATSPMTAGGQIVFAVGGGVILSVIRLFGAYPEGCMFSILIMNSLVPIIDKYMKPKKFGTEVNYG